MLFSLFDIKSQTNGPIFEAHTCEEAKRLVLQTLKSGRDTLITEYPEDYVLQQLSLEGVDNITHLISLALPVSVCSCSELKKLAFSVQSIEINNDNSTINQSDLIEKGSEVSECL